MASDKSSASSSESKPMSFLAFVSDGESFSALQNHALAQGWETEQIHKGDVHDAIKHLDTHPSPDFLLVDIANADEAASALDQLADVCEPDTRVIVTSTVDEFSFFRWLTDIGVHHYLLKPFDETMLKDAFSVSSKNKGTGEESVKMGKLVAVVGARGGVGSSTIALNLAASLANDHHASTVLLDLQPQWGTASLMLDLEPGRGLREALAQPDRIDTLFMDRVLLRYSENLSILSSEEPFDEDITVHDSAAETLLKETRQKFDMVVVDLPNELSHFNKEVLAAADHVIIVTELSLICLRDAMRLNDFLKEKMKLKKLHLVANKTGLYSKYEMPSGDFAKTLSSEFLTQIPFDIEHYGKTANGKLPALEKRDNAMLKSIHTIADTVHRAKSAKGQSETGGDKPKLMKWMKGKSS